MRVSFSSDGVNFNLKGHDRVTFRCNECYGDDEWISSAYIQVPLSATVMRIYYTIERMFYNFNVEIALPKLPESGCDIVLTTSDSRILRVVLGHENGVTVYLKDKPTNELITEHAKLRKCR